MTSSSSAPAAAARSWPRSSPHVASTSCCSRPARVRTQRTRVVALRERGEQSATGVFRFGPGDRTQAPWARDLPQNCFLWQTAGVGGSTVHYFAQLAARDAGRFLGLHGTDSADYDRAHAAPFGYRELIPYYEWVEHTLPVQTAAMGTKEERFLRGAAKLGLPHQTSKDITSPRTGRRRTRSSSRRARRGGRTIGRSSRTRQRGAARSAGTARRAASSP